MNIKKTFFLLAGELSGDLYGSQLIRSIKQTVPNTHFEGVGGPNMRKLGFHAIIKMESLEMMGFGEVIAALPRLYLYIKKIISHIIQTEPKSVIFIDFPDFNMYIAKKLRAKGYKGTLIHFICPSVWAWRSNRIKQLSKTLDLLLCIFPFEKKYFLNTSLSVEYVGNPLYQHIAEWKKTHQISLKDSNYISLFPGSRVEEVKRNLPVQLATVSLLIQKHPYLTFAISVAKENLRSLIKKEINKHFPELKENIHLFSSHQTYHLMAHSQLALATSGTVTLELALFNVPSVMVYILSKFNYLIGKYIAKLKLTHYCLPNILTNSTLFPEFIHSQAKAEPLSEALLALLVSKEKRNQCLEGCSQVQELLKTTDALSKTTQLILEKS